MVVAVGSMKITMVVTAAAMLKSENVGRSTHILKNGCIFVYDFLFFFFSLFCLFMGLQITYAYKDLYTGVEISSQFVVGQGPLQVTVRESHNSGSIFVGHPRQMGVGSQEQNRHEL